MEEKGGGIWGSSPNGLRHNTKRVCSHSITTISNHPNWVNGVEFTFNRVLNDLCSRWGSKVTCESILSECCASEHWVMVPKPLLPFLLYPFISIAGLWSANFSHWILFQNLLKPPSSSGWVPVRAHNHFCRSCSGPPAPYFGASL